MFPINLRLAGRGVLLVGAGRVGRRKLDKLIRAGAEVLVVEPCPDERLLALAADGLVRLEKSFSPEFLEGRSLVFAASSDHDLNKAVAEAAKNCGLWVNVADSAELSDFILPAVVEDGGFQVAISTGGAGPALAAGAAAELRKHFGPLYGRLTRLSLMLRPVILSAGLSPGEREAVFKRLINSCELKKNLAGNDPDSVLKIVKELILPVKLNDDFKLDSLL